MKCEKCGAALGEGEIFCPVCGAEVQLVPDFYSAQTISSVQRQKERQREKEEREFRERERRQREEEAQREKRRRDRKRRNRLIAACMALAALGGSAFIVKSYQDMKNDSSYSYQMARAETEFSNSRYEEALAYAQRAVRLEPESLDARVLRAQIYEKCGQESQAVAELEGIIGKNPEYEAAYGPLLRLYESEGESDRIKELLDGCNSDRIKKKYAGYICAAPVLGIPEGEYTEPQSLSLETEDDSAQIYYTLDGTQPDRLSRLYTGPIALEEGTVTVSAVAINAKGIRSDVVSAAYTVTLAPPDPPRITPASGAFTTDMEDTQIYVIVPEGCRAYYSFDRPATESDTLYEGPVEMPKGEHTFYAVLVNEYGKISLPGSATYVLREKG